MVNNPILRADFPDPDVIRVDDTYDMFKNFTRAFSSWPANIEKEIRVADRPRAWWKQVLLREAWQHLLPHSALTVA